MAAAVPAKAYGLKRKQSKRPKKGERSARQQLRAAKRAGVNAVYTPPVEVELASAVAQLAASSGVSVATQDELATIRVANKDAPKPTKQQPAKPAEPPKQRAAKPEQPKVKEEVKQEEPKQAAPKLSAKDKRRAKREARKAREAEQVAKKGKVVKQPKAAIPKPVKQQPKAQPVAQLTDRQQRIAELQAKHGVQPLAMVTENEALDIAASCNFDLSHYLKLLLDGETKQAKTYITGVSHDIQAVVKALITLHVDEIRDALHAGLQPDETLHSSEALEPRFKLKFEDPLVRKSDTALLYEEGGMHLFEFSEKVYVTVTDGEGKVIETERAYNRKVKLDRTKAYVNWLDQHYPIPKGVVSLNEYDKRTGEVMNDFALQHVIEPQPVMIGNLQVGTQFVLSEQTIPLSWEIARFKQELRNKASVRSRKCRGTEPVAGLVGFTYLEPIEAKAANDDEVVPWEEEAADEVAFVPLPNPRLEDTKRQVEILPPDVRTRLNPHPEYKDHLHLKPEAGPVSWAMPDNPPPKWVGRSEETINSIFLSSMTEPDREVGLKSNPGYRFDPGPPDVVSNVVQGPPQWFEDKHHVLGHEPMGPPKPAVVGSVTRDIKAIAKEELAIQCPPLPHGMRSLRRMEVPKMTWIHPVTVGYWVRKFAEQRAEMRAYRQAQEWMRDHHVVNFVHDDDRYCEMWANYKPVTVQEQLAFMEFNASSYVVQPVYHECKQCEDSLRKAKVAAREKEVIAQREKARRAKNPYGLTTIALQLKEKERTKNKAIKESAGSGPAKIGEPVIRASNPVKSNQDSFGGGQHNSRDTYGYNLEGYTVEERNIFLDTYEGRQVDIPWWRCVNSLTPSKVVDAAINGWVNRGRLLVPPSSG